jgi:outer membrane protein
VSVSVPILDNRRNKTNVQKADINRTIAKIDKVETESEVYNAIATYRLQAVSNQQKFSSGLTRLKYNKANYDAIYEKARIGTMNIVETLNARTSLLNAQQDVLQSKFLTVYNMQMLRLYSGETLTI